MVPTKKNFSLFPGLLTSKFRNLSRNFNKIPGLLRSFTNSNQKIYFLQNKNIYPVVYIKNSSFGGKSKNKYLSKYMFYITISNSWKLVLYTNFLT